MTGAVEVTVKAPDSLAPSTDIAMKRSIGRFCRPYRLLEARGDIPGRLPHRMPQPLDVTFIYDGLNPDESTEAARDQRAFHRSLAVRAAHLVQNYPPVDDIRALQDVLAPAVRERANPGLCARIIAHFLDANPRAKNIATKPFVGEAVAALCNVDLDPLESCEVSSNQPTYTPFHIAPAMRKITRQNEWFPTIAEIVAGCEAVRVQISDAYERCSNGLFAISESERAFEACRKFFGPEWKPPGGSV